MRVAAGTKWHSLPFMPGLVGVGAGVGVDIRGMLIGFTYYGGAGLRGPLAECTIATTMYDPWVDADEVKAEYGLALWGAPT